MSDTSTQQEDRPMSKIKEIGMFNTPKDWPVLQHWIEMHGPEDRIHLWTAACMAWNLAAKLANDGIEEEEVSDEATDS